MPAELTYLHATQRQMTMTFFDVLGHLLFKSSALTNWAIGPKNLLYFDSFLPQKCCLKFQQTVELVWKQIYNTEPL